MLFVSSSYGEMQVLNYLHITFYISIKFNDEKGAKQLLKMYNDVKEPLNFSQAILIDTKEYGILQDNQKHIL